MAEEQKQPEFVKVADVWMVKNDDTFGGLEMTFTQNVVNKDGVIKAILAERDYKKRPDAKDVLKTAISTP